MISDMVGFIAIELADYVLHTTDGGQTWQQINGPIANGVTGLNAITENTLYLYQVSNLYYTWDTGVNWETINMPTDDIIMDLLILPNGSAWVVGFNGLILYSPEIPVLVEIINTQVPDEYKLTQNYPNPFNPTTNIEYSIPASGIVTITVHNLLGQEVANLVDEFQQAGTYQITWNGNNLSSGIYFYRLQAGDFVQTRKMVLLK